MNKIKSKGSNKMNLTNQHGGNLDAIEKIYNIPKKDIIDFSGNINPLGISEKVKQAIEKNIYNISIYPDINYLKLKQSISHYTNVPIENIIPGNGSSELISLLIKTTKTKKSVIISPAYSEYEREVKLSEGNSVLFPLKEENGFILNLKELFNILDDSVNLLILCNPNNPTGSYIDNDKMSLLLKHCKNNNILVMVDETYVEFTDETKNISSVSLLNEYDNLFIIRGTSKFFASPGLRLGYALCSNKNIIDKINQNKDPWSVNILASFAGEVMFLDTEYINKTKNLILKEREKIKNELKNFKDIKLYDTQSNFFLIKILNNNINIPKICNELINYNIIVRDTSDFSFLDGKYMRFCILKPEQNNLLLNKLRNLLDIYK